MKQQTDRQVFLNATRLGNGEKLYFRRYSSSDKEACLRIFKSNVPTFFVDAEQAGFESYIDKYPEDVSLIADHSRDPLACGGISQRIDGEATLCWGMVLRSSHNCGIGRLLLLGRLHGVLRQTGIKQVRTNTSQLTEGFYRKFGFVTERIQKDAFSPGVDCCTMSLILDDETRRKLLILWQGVAG